ARERIGGAPREAVRCPRVHGARVLDVLGERARATLPYSVVGEGRMGLDRGRAFLAAAAMSVAGCAMFLDNGLNERELQPMPELEPPPSLFIEGEVRDARTLAAIRDAEVTVRGDPAGPASTMATTRTDAAGRFAMTFNCVRERVRPGWLEQNTIGTEPHDDWFEGIVVAVASKDHCAAPRRFGLGEIPKPLMIYVSPCEAPVVPAPQRARRASATSAGAGPGRW
ncbi:MAG TPA: carboxypeptidase-like regulatory domain-containing protein, partial [Anaeromyxobacteraceae bacterium]|nr:carboxypeptidase-like regulatory domain-containing protein [Anaeromyxobacteraceae bacterium]